MNRRCFAAAALIAAAATLGCGHIVPASVVGTTPGVTIVLKEVTIEPNKPFVPKEFVDPWEFEEKEILPDAYKRWLKKGALRGWLRVPGREPLHAVITFHELPKSAVGPGTRSYSISIDPARVQEASDGRVSVVYELVHTDGKDKYFGWVLWLSDRPL